MSGRGKRFAVFTGVGVLLVLLACVIPLGDDIAWWYTKRQLLRNPEWKEYRDHLYRLTPMRCNWIEGEKYAAELGGHLLAVNDPEEQEWVLNTFGTEVVWIGCTDGESEGNWQWTTGEAMSFTSWHPDEPNNRHATGEDFGILNFNRRGLWNDLGPTASEWGTIRGVVELAGPVRRK